MSEAAPHHPRDVFPQVRVPDPRGTDHTERLYPCFLADPRGQIVMRDNRMTLYYGSGRPSKTNAHTRDLYRCDVDARALWPP